MPLFVLLKKMYFLFFGVVFTQKFHAAIQIYLQLTKHMIEPHQNIFELLTVVFYKCDWSRIIAAGAVFSFFFTKILMEKKQISSDSVHGSPLDFVLLFFLSSFPISL